MSRIFVSHSSADNAAALALARWLEELGWNDYFLDISIDRGLFPGERWQQALRLAADRCEAVLFLISPAWRDSRWCLAEFLLAKQLGKPVFGVLVEPTPLDTLPHEMTAEWQLCDLVAGAERRTLEVAFDPIVPPTSVSFADVGLARLKLGLQRARVAATTFAWPPPSDVDRPPYRGLKPLDVSDAAVFFGREAAIVRGLDALRQLRERGVEQMLVIVGASGAGKSSYLRAGLWPRLERDDRLFLPIPVIRPARAVLTGSSGLVASLDAAFKHMRQPKNRADVLDALRQQGGLGRQLMALQGAAVKRLGEDALAPTVVIPIDQGEELFDAEGRVESEVFLTLLQETLSSQDLSVSRAGPGGGRPIAVVGIRSEALERLQEEQHLASVGRVLFGLDPLPTGALKAIIEGPAERSTAVGRPLKVDPDLTEQLLKDAAGADALPLLAFTLERLFVDYGSDGILSAADYDDLGRVRGAIDAAIQAACNDPARQPAIPADSIERERSLRRGFIPWLAIVDPYTDEPRRRVARWDEIPEEARSLFERLIEVRLLVRDRRSIDDGGDHHVVIEIGHEALLRQWPTLTRWLAEDAEVLKTVEAVRRAAVEWLRNERGSAWLVHTGERLEIAETLRRRHDFEELLADAGREYLLACQARDERARAEREGQVARIAAEQSRTARAQRLAKWLLASVGIVLLLLGGWIVLQSRDVGRQRSAMLIVASEEALNSNSYDRALRFAVLATESTWLSPARPEAEAQLARAALLSPEITRFSLAGPPRSFDFSPEGQRIVIALDKTARVVDAQTGREIARITHNGVVRSASFSPDGQHIVTGSDDKTARISDSRSGKETAQMAHEEGVDLAAFSPDGRRIVTAAGGTLRVIDLPAGNEIARMACPNITRSVAFSPDGQRIVGACSGGTARVFDAQTGKEISRVVHKGEVYSAAFSLDGQRIVTGSEDDTASIVEAETGKELVRLQVKGEAIFSAFRRDGLEVVTASDSGIVQGWWVDTGEETWRVGHQEASSVFVSVGLSRDGRYILAAADRTAWVFDAQSGTEIAQVIHDSPVTKAAFSPDGQLIVTGDEARTVRVTAVRIGKELPSNERGPGTFSPDGRYVVAGGQIADVSTGKTLPQPQYLRFAQSIAFSPDSQRIVVCCLQKSTAAVYEVQTGKEIARLDNRAEISSAVYSPDGRHILTTSTDKTARIIDLQTGKEISRIRAVNQATFSPDGQRIATASDDRTARIVDPYSGKEIAVAHDGAVKSVAFSPDGRRIATASDDRTARVIAAYTGEEITRVTHDEGVVWVTFSPDGQRIATVSGMIARVSNARTGKEIARGRVNQYPGKATFSPDGQRLVTPEGAIFDAQTGKEIVTFSLANGTALSPDGLRLVTRIFNDRTRLFDGRFVTRGGRQLIDVVCAEKLVGTRLLSAADVASAPVLASRTGEDVCAQSSLFERLIRGPRDPRP
jgi:WD40 repeat protein